MEAKKIIPLLIFYIVSGTTHKIASAQPMNTGPEVANNLNVRFNDTAKMCKSLPGYMCSGVIIRGLSSNGNPWEYSDDSERRGSVSFSYIRSDIDRSSSQLYRGYGIIFLPPIVAKQINKDYKVLCIYPTNAWTNERGDHGCGDILAKNEDFSSCSKHGIFNATQWIDFYNKDPLRNICSFSSQSAALFLESIETQNLKNSLSGYKQVWNEYLVSAWDQADPLAAPIEAFWFNDQSEQNLGNIRLKQAYYFNDTGVWLPILKLTSEKFSPFIYDDAYQVIKPPF